MNKNSLNTIHIHTQKFADNLKQMQICLFEKIYIYNIELYYIILYNIERHLAMKLHKCKKLYIYIIFFWKIQKNIFEFVKFHNQMPFHII